MHRKLWPAKEGTLGHMLKIVQVYFTFFEKRNRFFFKIELNRFILQCDYICFSIPYCQVAQKKMENIFPITFQILSDQSF